MAKTVVIIGTLDTKGTEFAFIKELIEKEGLKTLVVDFGVIGDPTFKADIPRDEVAGAGGGNLAHFASGEHKDQAMKTMTAGLVAVVRRLYDEGKLHGIIGMGGTGGTSIATAAMRTLPVGVPKVMVSTVGGGDVSAYAGTKDITFIPSIVDVAGINRISRQIFSNAAGAISGMVKRDLPEDVSEKPLVAASMFGNTTTCVDHARGILEKKGYEVLVFHATGTGGKTMESLISDGHIAASMDITTTELADQCMRRSVERGPRTLYGGIQSGHPCRVSPGLRGHGQFRGH
jgi:uncharacterized protein (UPF0261 family)